MEFEWEPSKAKSNLRKHAIPFDYAIRVFLDENRLEQVDSRTDYRETRWITIGLINNQEIVVVYTVREENIDYSDIPSQIGVQWTRPGALIPIGNKHQVTLRLDADVLNFFKKTGKR